ncbi:MAG: endonuclease [Caulobacteraceae bacterium]|nr:endonuclease [Caulobacteraceae bacterium]
MGLRVMTYNVHRCVGTDRRLDPARIADVIATAEPDVVALQELDVGRARTGGVDQAHALADLLGMRSHFHAALKVEEERYGDAILTALPERLIKAGPLPGYPRIPGLEPRGALWVEVVKDGQPWQVINTHLGLVPKEQQVQAAALVRDWLADERFVAPGVLLGDFNAPPHTVAYRTLAAALRDAQGLHGRTPTACFPSGFPFLRIDHVFVTGKVRVAQVSSPFHPKARVASDHLPLVVDLEFGD